MHANPKLVYSILCTNHPEASPNIGSPNPSSISFLLVLPVPTAPLTAHQTSLAVAGFSRKTDLRASGKGSVLKASVTVVCKTANNTWNRRGGLFCPVLQRGRTMRRVSRFGAAFLPAHHRSSFSSTSLFLAFYLSSFSTFSTTSSPQSYATPPRPIGPAGPGPIVSSSHWPPASRRARLRLCFFLLSTIFLVRV